MSAFPPDQDPSLVHVSFTEDGTQMVNLHMTPSAARHMAVDLYDEADRTEARPTFREQIKARWRPGGSRDWTQAIAVSAICVALLSAFDGSLYDSVTSRVLGYGMFVLGIGLVIYRAWRDRRDLDEEARERRYTGEVGEQLDAETGRLPWRIVR
ncbi:hypothetical protein SEA_IDYN_12 [Gordonia phage IDyn]|uniref:Uncharacterized protein n=1 Tax=Gordonia phage IDyn TaxID=2510506 RepID=A0A411CU16_9CAUD|nr:membrane protein [Gordonia phage IDyn]QAY17360.1 hypothetical protein SEA_IDYN_12 [Gordonia phage IDyn]